MTNVRIEGISYEKLKQLKIDYKKRYGINISFLSIVAKLIDNAKVEDLSV